MPVPFRRFPAPLPILALAAVLVLGACSGDGPEASGTAAATVETSSAFFRLPAA